MMLILGMSQILLQLLLVLLAMLASDTYAAHLSRPNTDFLSIASTRSMFF